MKKTYKYINKMGDTFDIQDGQHVRVLDINGRFIQWCEVELGCVRLPSRYAQRNFARSVFYCRLDELRERGYYIDKVIKP